MKPSDRLREMMEHALLGSKKVKYPITSKTAYRNFYSLPIGGIEESEWDHAVARGWARKRPPDGWHAADQAIYHVTPDGILALNFYHAEALAKEVEP